MRQRLPAFGSVHIIPPVDPRMTSPDTTARRPSRAIAGITRLVLWATGVFYRAERAGVHVPGGPLMIVANHPNSLMDPLLVLRASDRPVRALAKAPLFDVPVLGRVLRGLGALPVYRRQDDPTQMERNQDTFRAAVAALLKGEAVLIFPEGRSHSEPAVAPLKTGAARIACQAEAAAGWDLGLQVVPMGLNYGDKRVFRSRVLVARGEPLAAADWGATYATDPVEAVRSLTEAIAAALRGVTLNLADIGDRELLETAEILYARAHGWSGWRERDALRERIPRLQRFAEGLAWLRESDPARVHRLTHAVRRYHYLLGRLGAGEADVPPRYGVRPVARFVIREAAVLGLGLPLAAVGTVAWYPPYLAIRFAVSRAAPEPEAVATAKLIAATLAYPLMYAVWLAAIGWRWGPLALAIAAVVLPPVGWIALAWHERRGQVWEDVRLFWQVVRRRGIRERLDRRRSDLAAEFDAVARAWQAGRAYAQREEQRS